MLAHTLVRCLPGLNRRFLTAERILANAIAESVLCGRVLLVPRIELNRAENFNVPSRTAAADYFDLAQTIVTRKGSIVPFSFIESDQWPDMDEPSVASLGPEEPLDTECSKRILVRHLSKKTKAFYNVTRDAKQHKPIRRWRRPDHKDIKVQLQLAPLWREMADETINGLGGAGSYFFLELKDDQQRTIFSLSQQSGLKKAHKLMPADAVVYLSYNRCLPPSQKIHDTTSRLLSSNRRVLSYKDFPRLKDLIETDNVLLLDNFALILIEGALKKSSTRALAI